MYIFLNTHTIFSANGHWKNLFDSAGYEPVNPNYFLRAGSLHAFPIKRSKSEPRFFTKLPLQIFLSCSVIHFICLLSLDPKDREAN